MAFNRDYDAGGREGYDPQGDGYVTINPDLYNYFNQNYGTNFGSTEDYLKWVYGGGQAETVLDPQRGYSLGSWFKTPNGVDKTVNTPLSYDPQGMEFADYVLAGMGAVAGAGLTGMLPGTTNVFSGLTGGFSNPFSGVTNLFGGGENVLPGMDLSGYLTGVDAGPGFLDPTLMSGVEGAAGFSFDPSLASQQAIDGSMQTIYDQAAAAGMPGYDSSLVSSAAGAMGGSGGIMGTINDFIKSPLGSLIGKVGPSVLGYLGANAQTDAANDRFNTMLGLGAPYRGLLQNTFSPGYDISKEPGLQSALDTAFNTYMRAASAGRAPGVSRGNPFDNPGAIMEGQKYLLGNVALPYLQNTRNALAAAGGLGVSQSVPFGTMGINAEGGKYDAIGYGLGELLNPQQTGISLTNPLQQYRLGGLV